MYIKKTIFWTFLFHLLYSCAGMVSGRNVMLREGDSVSSLSKEFNVPVPAILNANKGKNWSPGHWVFIPLRVGVLPKIAGNLPPYGRESYTAEEFYSDRYLWPVPSSKRMTSLFGEIRNKSKHYGIDIAGMMGENVVAVDEGVVLKVDFDSNGYGKVIYIQHSEEISTRYAHLSEQWVSEGSKVQKGQVIGLVGNSGRSTGPHLHFELRKFDRPINPMGYFIY